MSLCMERGGRYGFGNEKPNQLDPPDIVAQRRGDFMILWDAELTCQFMF